MERRKKKTRKKSKVVPTGPGADHHVHGQPNTSTNTPSSAAEDHDFTDGFMQGVSSSEIVELDNELEKVQKRAHFCAGSPHAAAQETQEAHRFEVVDASELDSRLEDGDSLCSPHLHGEEGSNETLFDELASEVQIENAQMRALIIQLAQMQTIAQDKATAAREFEAMQEALVMERETGELLRDQMTFLQGHIAEREVQEIGSHAEIERLNAENRMLQNLLTDLKEIVEKLEQERELTEAEQRKMDQEIREMVSKQQEGNNREETSKQIIIKMEQEKETSEEERRQLLGKMEHDRELWNLEKRQMKSWMEQQRKKHEQENRQMITKSEEEREKLVMENIQIMEKMEHEREKFELEIRKMTEMMEQEREKLDLERREMSAHMEQERERVEQENWELLVEIKHDRERLEHDRKTVAAKMAALETGLEQLERGASVRASVGKDLAAVVDEDSSKKWVGWSVYGKDPLAEAVAVAEEARMQKMAIEQTVDKLLTENVELTRKVNEQSAMINDLTQQYQTMANISRKTTFEVENANAVSDAPKKINIETQKVNSVWGADSDRNSGVRREDATLVSVARSEHLSGPISGHKLANMNGGCTDDEAKDRNFDLPNGNASTVEVPKNISEEITEVITTRETFAREMKWTSSNSSITLEEKPAMGNSAENFSTIPEEPTILTKHTQQTNPVPRLGIIRAPIRLFSFVTGYISGADLVKG